MVIDLARRKFIAALGGAAVGWPLAAHAQQGERIRRIGVLNGAAADDPIAQADNAAFVQGLQQLGWTEGRNVHIDWRWAAGNTADMRKYAMELVALAPDVILGVGSTVGPLLEATRTVPIVFAIVPDPVGSGFIDSLSRPGGNATGFLMFEYSLCGKWLELLREIGPGVTRAAVLRDAALTAGVGQFAVIQSVAPSVGVEVNPVNMGPGRGRARRRGLRAPRQWRSDLDGERVGGGSSRSDHHACRPVQTAGDLLRALLICRQRRIDFVWAEFRRPVSTSGRLRRSHPQGREAGRFARAGADQIRACGQPEDRQGVRAYHSTDRAQPRRRGNRISLLQCDI